MVQDGLKHQEVFIINYYFVGFVETFFLFLIRISCIRCYYINWNVIEQELDCP